MDPIVKWHFLQTFSWAAEALMREEQHLGWTPEELAWPEKVRMGENVKLPANCRPLRDRFSRVFQDFFRGTPGNAIEYRIMLEDFERTIFAATIPASPTPV